MKFAIPVAVVALLGCSLASKIQVIHTGAEKSVPELITFYEGLVGRLVPDGLFHRRQTRNYRPGAGGLELNAHPLARGSWPKNNGSFGDLAYTYDSDSDSSTEDFTAGGLQPRDGYLHGGLSPRDNWVGGNLGSFDDSVTGGRPHILHSAGIHRQSDGFTASGRKPHDGSLHGGLSPRDNYIGGNPETSNNFVGAGRKPRDGYATGGLTHTYDSVGKGRETYDDVITAGLKPRDGFKDEGVSLTDDSIGRRVHVPTYYPVGEGLGTSDGHLAGDPKSYDGSTAGGLRLTDLSVGEGLVPPDDLTAGGKVAPDYYGEADEYPTPTDANSGSLEGLIIGQVPNDLFHRRQARIHFPGAGGHEPSLARGSWRNDGSIDGDLPHTYDSVVGSSTGDYTARGSKPRNGFLHGVLSPRNDSVGGNLGPFEDSVTGGSPHDLHSDGLDRRSDGFTAGGRKPQAGSLHGGLSPNDNPVAGDLESSNGGDRTSRDRFATGGLPHTNDSVDKGRQSSYVFTIAGLKPQDGSLHGGLSPSDNPVAGDLESSNGGGRTSRDGSTTGGLPHTNDSIGKGRQFSEDFITAGLKPRDGSKNEGLSPTDDSIAGRRVHVPTHHSIGESQESSVVGDRKSHDGPTAEGIGLTNHSVGEALISTEGLITGGQVSSDYNLEGDEYPTPTDADYKSNETSEAGELSPRMRKEIDDVRAAFMLSVSPNYDGMSSRKLWKALMRKQKQLETLRLQLQHLLYIKRERLRKLNGIPWQYNVPSKALSTAIIRDIEKLVAYRPKDYSKL